MNLHDDTPDRTPQCASRSRGLPGLQPWRLSLYHRDRVRQAQSAALNAFSGSRRPGWVAPPAAPLTVAGSSFADRARAAQRQGVHGIVAHSSRRRYGG